VFAALDDVFFREIARIVIAIMQNEEDSLGTYKVL